MIKFNSFCKECFDPHKVIWNCKKHIEDKDWIYLCSNCIRYFKYLNKRNFKSQFENIKSMIRCKSNPSELDLPLYEIY
jgi:hypothetical protein